MFDSASSECRLGELDLSGDEPFFGIKHRHTFIANIKYAYSTKSLSCMAAKTVVVTTVAIMTFGIIIK